MSQLKMQSQQPRHGELWRSELIEAEGGRVTMVLDGGGERFTLIREGMSVASRAYLAFDDGAQAQEAARLWRMLADDPRERFSELGAVRNIPLYALRKPAYENDPESGIFGINGGGSMGLTPCMSFNLSRSEWAAMASLGETLASGMRRAGSDRRYQKLSKAQELALKESVELWARLSQAPSPAPKSARPGL